MSGFLERNSSFFTVEPKKNVTCHTNTLYNKKSSTYTQGDYSGLLYDINIYIPEVPPFWEKIAYVSIFYKISSCEQKKNVICYANTNYN